MAVLPIRHYPDPVLRNPAAPVDVIDDKLRQLAADMIDTMIDANGVGIAAPQVGVGLRMVIVDVDPTHREPRVLINPAIVRRSKKIALADEGCLSFPGLRGKVKRSEKVVCEAKNLDGEIVEYHAEGYTARAIQHEVDHLDGELFIDKVTPAERPDLDEGLAGLEAAFRHKKPE